MSAKTEAIKRAQDVTVGSVPAWAEVDERVLPDLTERRELAHADQTPDPSRVDREALAVAGVFLAVKHQQARHTGCAVAGGACWHLK